MNLQIHTTKTNKNNITVQHCICKNKILSRHFNNVVSLFLSKQEAKITTKVSEIDSFASSPLEELSFIFCKEVFLIASF